MTTFNTIYLITAILAVGVITVIFLRSYGSNKGRNEIDSASREHQKSKQMWENVNEIRLANERLEMLMDYLQVCEKHTPESKKLVKRKSK